MTKSTQSPKSKINSKWLSEIKTLLDETRVTGSKALNARSLNAYWRVGQRIDALASQTRAFVTEIARGVGSSYQDLQRCRLFYRTWPDGVPAIARTLSWTQHLLLLPVSDEKARRFYLEQALEQGWSGPSLARAIAQKLYDDRAHFSGKVRLKSQIQTPLNVYPAVFVRAIDGDSFIARLDLGFETWTERRLRLKGLNTAELTGKSANPKAQAAKAFLIQKLKPCERILIQTFKSDIYGRFLADVYYHPALTKKDEIAKRGFYLNQQLLDEGLAVPMMV